MLFLSEVLRRIGEDSDDDFDGYVDEEVAEDNDGGAWMVKYIWIGRMMMVKYVWIGRIMMV